jgi:NSS family neurotransmitter:Na+ symporter
VIVGIISAQGLEKGIEKACKIMMPALFAMLLLLVARSVTLPGAMEGVKWYLAVDFSKITGQSILDALGQSFFSIGIASGGAFIYGSYLAKDSNIPGDGLLVVAFDTTAALLAGFMIFPAIFALGMNPASGESLLFITMSNLFDQIPFGGIFGSIFFLLVFFAALSSALGYFEPILTTIVDLGKISRKKAVVVGLSLIFIVGFPTIMAKGAWKDILIFGRNFFDFADFFSGNIMMPLGAIVLSLYTAYKWTFNVYQKETNVGAGAFRVSNLWKPLVLYLIPVALVIIFVRGVFF